jgi:hypothetical protein
MNESEEFRFQDYFKGVDEHLSTYVDDEVPACTYTARVIYEALKKKGTDSKILWLANKEDQTGHAYIVIDGQADDELPYNRPILRSTDDPTVGELRRKGEDITQEIIGTDWKRL